MSEDTARLALPLLQAGQAQKEIDHNEALTLIDALLHLHVEGIAADPPGAPEAGDCWLVAAPASGAWAAREDAIALWTTGGWRFVAPVAGMRAALGSTGRVLRWTGAGWADGVIVAQSIRIGAVQVLGAQAAAVADPAGGATVDSEARATLAAVLAALRGHGLIAA